MFAAFQSIRMRVLIFNYVNTGYRFETERTIHLVISLLNIYRLDICGSVIGMVILVSRVGHISAGYGQFCNSFYR
jgi:hypothetical protein